jgi:hypothetical protein
MGIDINMFVRTKEPVTETEVRKAAIDMCAVFGVDRFWLDRKNGRHALAVVPEVEQDGPTIRRKKGETFILVYTFGRYWGEGYERGDLAFVIAVSMWLETRFPSSEVWYGGHSSGICAELLDAHARKKLVAHAASKNGADYHRPHPNPFLSEQQQDPPQYCEFCAGEQMTPCRWGGGGTGYVCQGCGLHRLVRPGCEPLESTRGWSDKMAGGST